MRTLAFAMAAALSLGSAAYADDEIDDDIRVEGKTVTFEEIAAEKPGYVVIHAVRDGTTVVPASIGHAPIQAGENKGVVVTLDDPPAAGANYVAMLHAETNGNSTYDFGEGSTDVDPPVLDDGKPETQGFKAP